MTKKVLAFSGALLAALLAIVFAKGDAISFAKGLKGTQIKAEPVKQEKPIVLAKVMAEGDCF